MSIASLEFELPNAGPGPDPLSLSTLAADVDAVVLLFQRDHFCTKCRQQVRDVAGRYDEFERRGAEVASVLPEPLDRVRTWHERYDLPFPLLADADNRVGDQYDQPTRFGALGGLHDLLGRMPEAVVLDTRDGIEVFDVHSGSTPADRPSVDDLLATIDELRES